MSFHNAELEKKYRALGFTDYELGMMASIGGVKLEAVEHPFHGVALFFTSADGRTATQFEIMLPVSCSIAQVAGLIYVNFTRTFPEGAQHCRQHFEKLKIRLFK